MDTKFWGPPGWQFLHTITFNYPMVIDKKKANDRILQKNIKSLFYNLQYTLPCKYCRQSFAIFLKKLPIDDYLGGRADLAWWLYSIHNMVNEKLRKQEHELFDKEVKKLANRAKTEKWNAKRIVKEHKDLEKKILYTGPDPTFAEVCAKYEQYRAGCSTGSTKTCSSPRFRSGK